MSDLVKKMKPFMQRADELEARVPFAAFYCRMHVTETLMKARQSGASDGEADKLLMEALEGAEKLKASVDLQGGPAKMEEFALSVFKAADDVDRNGEADQGVALRFYASSLFLDVLAQFHSGELPPDLVEKRKYARYKTAYIRDCLKKGIKPEAGPPGGEPECQQDGSGSSSNHPDQSMTPEAGPGTAGGYREGSDPQAPPVAAFTATPPPVPSAADDPGVPRKSQQEAKRKAELAVSALDFEDVPTAKKLLTEALQLLGT